MSQEFRSSPQDPGEEQLAPGHKFTVISNTFMHNVGTIRVFNEQIGPVADEHDRNVIHQFREQILKLVPELESAEGTLEIAHGDNGDASGSSLGNAEKDTEAPVRLNVDQETWRSIGQALTSMAKRSPTQGHLLRQGALTSLISFLEILISELIQLYYSMYPGRLSANKSLTLETLRELDSTKVEDIEAYMASVEASNLLYNKGLKDQLTYFEELGVKIEPLKPEFKHLIEITQRRNLFVHNRGIANRQYLSRVDNELIKEYEIEQGKQLVVTERYLNAAMDAVYASGLALIQLCWRNWDKSSTERADDFVVDPVLYDALREKRFELTKRIAERLQGARFVSEHAKRRMVVNHAIALKELGRMDDMKSVLSCMNWSTTSLDYTLAVHALRNEEEEFYALFPKAVRAEAVEFWHLVEWPVYAHLRGTERFTQVIEEHFPNETSKHQRDADS